MCSFPRVCCAGWDDSACGAGLFSRYGSSRWALHGRPSVSVGYAHCRRRRPTRDGRYGHAVFYTGSRQAGRRREQRRTLDARRPSREPSL